MISIFKGKNSINIKACGIFSPHILPSYINYIIELSSKFSTPSCGISKVFVSSNLLLLIFTSKISIFIFLSSLFFFSSRASSQGEIVR